eukprot:9435771-Prorocentrum_lima.AAC.1
MTCFGANSITVEYVPSQETAAYALTKGLTTAVHRKAMLLLCLLDMEQELNRTLQGGRHDECSLQGW